MQANDAPGDHAVGDHAFGEHAFESALVAELAKKSGLVWVSYGVPPRHHPVWHTWTDGAICIVAGGSEQPLPQIEDQSRVEVTLRSKTTRTLLATITAVVEVIGPGSPTWGETTGALLAGRLNLIDQETALQRWADSSTVVRLVPVAIDAAPGRLPDDAAREAPVGSPALTTQGTPWVAHRRARARPPLSG